MVVRAARHRKKSSLDKFGPGDPWGLSLGIALMPFEYISYLSFLGKQNYRDGDPRRDREAKVARTSVNLHIYEA